MKAKVKNLAMLIVAALVAVFTVGYAFAWFFDRRDTKFSLSGASAGAYFESGDGSEETPFVISNSTHMRNLAVLQNTGRFVDGNNNPKKYYFEIKKTLATPLDMGSLWLPPIGSDENPFIGEFNGNGKTIKNLKVTTDKALLTEAMYPTQAAEGYKFSQAVGLFGNTGEDSNIRNFILDNPHVVVGKEGVNNNKYGSASAKTVGIAVGRVAGKCQSIGVRATDAGKNTADGVGSTTLDVRVTGYSTFNSILGGLDEGVQSSVTGGGHVAGSNAGFGGSLDFASVVERLTLIDGSTQTWTSPTYEFASNSTRLYQNGTQSVTVNGMSYGCYTTNYVPLIVENDLNSEYYNSNTAEIPAENNIGYYTGNELRITTKSLSASITVSDCKEIVGGTEQTVSSFGANTVLSDLTIYTKNSDGESAITIEDGIKAKVLELINESAGSKNRYIYGVRPRNQIQVNNPVQVQNMVVAGNSYTTSSYIPNSAIWFVPQMDGYVKIVLATSNDGASSGFNIYELERPRSNDGNPYSIPITSSSNISSIVKNNKTGEVLTNSYDYTSDYTLLYSENWTRELTKNRFYYYEIPVKGGTEYAFGCQNNGNNPYILYMDVGQNAPADNSAVLPNVVSAVDFIYEGVEIEQTDTTIGVGNFIVNTSGTKALYNASKTSVYFDGITAILKVVYVRLNEESGKHSGKTICLENSDTQFDTTSEVKATYATYVCPTIGGGSGTVSSGGGGGGTVDPNPGPDDSGLVTSITLTGAPSTMAVGDTAELTANVLPNTATDKTVTWASSNSNIASVDSTGKVTANAAGEVTISATANDGSGKRGIAVITVTGGSTTGTVTSSVDFKTIFDATDGKADSSGRKEIADVTHQNKFAFEGGKISEDSYNNQTYSFNITLNGTASNSITLEGLGASGNGAKVSIVVTDADGNEVGRSSQQALSNENVSLTLDNLAAGTYTVSAVKTNQSGSGSIKFTTISVTENYSGTGGDEQELTLSVDSETMSLTVDGATQKINATASISDATITYSSNKPDIASVASDGTVTAKAAGIATITVTATDGKTTVTKTVTVNVSAEQTAEKSANITFVSGSGTKYSVNGSSDLITLTPGSKFNTINSAEGTTINNIDCSGGALKLESGPTSFTIKATSKVKVTLWLSVNDINIDGSDVRGLSKDTVYTDYYKYEFELNANTDCVIQRRSNGALYLIEVTEI